MTPPVDTSSSTAVPIPILVLGGMSLALLAAGGIGYVSRRRREDRDHVLISVGTRGGRAV